MVVVYEKNCFYPGVKPAGSELVSGKKETDYPHGDFFGKYPVEIV